MKVGQKQQIRNKVKNSTGSARGMRTKNDYIFVYLVATDKGAEEARLRDCVDGEFNPILSFASGVVGLFRMTEGKAKRAYSFQAVRAETIFVGSAQPLG